MKEHASKRAAQREAGHAQEFRRYRAQLERDQVRVLSEDSGNASATISTRPPGLVIRFDVGITGSQRQISIGMRVIYALGALALCIANFLACDGGRPSTGPV